MILIFGRGFLGTRLSLRLPGAVLSSADICDPVAVRAELGAHPGAAVINAAGKTGRPNVDWCESNREATWRSNVVGPLVLAEACAEAGAWLLHVGSGCIFYGPSPSPGGWREDDHANPESFYSRTKYAADLVLSRLPDVAVVRIRMPIDGVPGPRNLVTKLAHYPVVADVVNSVTIVDDLVDVVGALCERRATGVFHAVNPGVLSHRHILERYRDRVDPSHRCTFVAPEELVERGCVVRARSNCTLASPRLAEIGITMPPVEQGFERALEAYAIGMRSPSW